MNFKKVSFAHAAPHLVISLDSDSEILKDQCERGISQCWEVGGGDAYMLTRSDGSELVICCFEGKNIKQAAPLIVKAATENGFKSIRFHTERPALARLINQQFKYVETIFRMKL